MPRLLASSPLSWILAVGTSSDAGPAELLFGLPKAAEYVQRMQALGHYYPSPYLTDWGCLVEAQVLEARHGPRAALDFLADALAGLPEHRSVLLTDPASARRGWSGSRWPPETASRPPGSSRPSARWREATPRSPSSAHLAEHAEGLLTSDVSLLQHLSTELPDPWARACAVEDQGVLLAAAGRDREAIRSLEEALREYDRLGQGAPGRGAYRPTATPARGAAPARGE